MVRRAKEATMPRRAYSYIRYSSAKQRKGRSAKRQREWAPAVCKAEGWLLDESARMTDDGVSAFRGRNGDTGALAAFLADVEVGIVPRGSVLLVESLDRLSREEVDEAWELWRKLLKAGISIKTREPDRFYDASAKFDMFTMLEVLFIFARAHEESATRSMRIGDIWQERRRAAREDKRPRGKRCPCWLEVRDGRYVKRPGPCNTIRAIYDQVLAGLGRRRLLRWLQERQERYPPFGTSGKWVASFLDRLLTDRAALGEYQPKRRAENGRFFNDGPPIAGYYPAVVSEEDWLRVQAGGTGRRRAAGRPAVGALNLFTGICFHARYGCPVSLAKSKPRGGQVYSYLQVDDDNRGGTGQGRGDLAWRYDHFEAGVLEAVEELQLRDVLPPGPEADAREKRLAELTHRMVALDQRAKLLKHRAEDPAASDQEAEDALDSLATVRQQHKEAAAESARLKLESDAGRGEGLSQLQSLLSLWREAQGTDQEGPLGERIKGALRRVVDSLWVLPQRLARERTVLHVQVYLRSGQRRYLQIRPSSLPPGCTLWQLEESDFRKGDIGDAAGKAPVLA
jgi:DNA invertase Pin-like site-specific DNA recombinase